jgi:hypothetical protein
MAQQSQPPASTDTYGGATPLDLAKYPTAQEFVARCHEFFREVKDLYVLFLHTQHFSHT